MTLVIESREEIINKIISLINKKLPPKEAKLAAQFAEQYYSNVPMEDLLARSIQDLYGALLSHWNLISKRRPGESKIAVYNPHYDQHGWQSTHTVIEVATDDMPFLVDSLMIELNRRGFKTHFMVHLGGVKLRRDEHGKVMEILPIDAPQGDSVLEAPIYIEMDRQSDPKVLESLHDGLKKVIQDVRVVVEDWSKMRAKMREALSELEKNPPPADKEDLKESIDFLKWLEDDHFTYLGCRDYVLEGEGDQQALVIKPGSGLGVLRHEDKSKNVRPLSSLPPAARKL